MHDIVDAACVCSLTNLYNLTKLNIVKIVYFILGIHML